MNPASRSFPLTRSLLLSAWLACCVVASVQTRSVVLLDGEGDWLERRSAPIYSLEASRDAPAAHHSRAVHGSHSRSARTGWTASAIYASTHGRYSKSVNSVKTAHSIDRRTTQTALTLRSDLARRCRCVLVLGVMTPSQLAKYCLWIENNEWTMQMLNHQLLNSQFANSSASAAAPAAKAK